MPPKNKKQKQQERSLSRASSVSLPREESIAASTISVDPFRNTKPILPTPALCGLLVLAWFLPLFQDFSIWKLLLGSQSLDSSSCMYSSNPSQLTMLRIAIISLFCSSMTASLGNKLLTAFLTMAGCLLLFSLAFIQASSVSMSMKELMLTREGSFRFFLSGEYFGFAFVIFALVHLILQLEMKSRRK